MKIAIAGKTESAAASPNDKALEELLNTVATGIQKNVGEYLRAFGITGAFSLKKEKGQLSWTPNNKANMFEARLFISTFNNLQISLYLDGQGGPLIDLINPTGSLFRSEIERFDNIDPAKLANSPAELAKTFTARYNSAIAAKIARIRGATKTKVKNLVAGLRAAGYVK